MIKCPRCQINNSTIATYCTNCGNRLTSTGLTTIGHLSHELTKVHYPWLDSTPEEFQREFQNHPVSDIMNVDKKLDEIIKDLVTIKNSISKSDNKWDHIQEAITNLEYAQAEKEINKS